MLIASLGFSGSCRASTSTRNFLACPLALGARAFHDLVVRPENANIRSRSAVIRGIPDRSKNELHGVGDSKPANKEGAVMRPDQGGDEHDHRHRYR